MEQIVSFDRVSSLISSCMRKGVKTNNFLTAGDYLCDIASGSLFCHAWPGGLLILRRRPGYSRLYFHLLELHSAPDIEINEPVVLELTQKPADRDAGHLLEYWKNAGFRDCLNRIRLQRAGTEPCPEINTLAEIRRPQLSEQRELAGLYESCFDRYTGCIPDTTELRAIIDNGDIFCISAPDKAIGGFISFNRFPSGSRICHLAVREDLRGRGISKALISFYLRSVNPKRSLVWTAEDNVPAQRAYLSCGYSLDGWRSAVLISNRLDGLYGLSYKNTFRNMPRD